MRVPSTTVRLGAVLAAAVLSLAFACPAFASSFSDVPDDAWYGADNEACIEYVAEKGFMTGYAGTDLFGPEDTLTRAQVVTALYRVITGDPDGLTSDPASYVADNESGFSDTKGGAYYTAALNWAVAEDVARGSGGRFRPNDPVTREEFVTFMARAADFYYPPFAWHAWPVVPGGKSFYDWSEVSSWAWDGFEYINEYGLIEGRLFTEGPAEYYFFYPQRNATRAEAAAMLMRFNDGIVYYFGIETRLLSIWWVLQNEPEDRYCQDRLRVTLDNDAKLADGTSFRDYIDDVLGAGAGQQGDRLEPGSCMFDLALLAPPGDGAIDALSQYGSVEVVRLWQDWNSYSRDAYVVLPEGVTLRDALLDLMKDDRVYGVRLVEAEDSQ